MSVKCQSPTSAGLVRNPSAYPRLTAPPFLNHWVATLARMGEILIAQLDFYRCARSNFARWNDVRKKVSCVIAARLLASGCNDGRTSNRHSLTVGEAPIAINCIGVRGMIE